MGTVRQLMGVVAGTVSALRAMSIVSRTLVLGVAAMLISGLAHAWSQPADDADAAAELVDSIVIGEADIKQVPGGFTSEMGYVPDTSSGTLRHPFGGCSTPVKLGPDRFEVACQIHDLGYDVLRYSEREGHTPRIRARFALDWRLYEDLLHLCETPTCSATATFYYTAVTFNSVRQGFRTPHEEPATPWVMLAVTVFGLGAFGGMRSG